jgi:hypothetical protein
MKSYAFTAPYVFRPALPFLDLKYKKTEQLFGFAMGETYWHDEDLRHMYRSSNRPVLV